jgi:predicted choloylglycine hydrolase
METFVFNFGKYKGESIDKVAKENPAYLKWLSGATTTFSLKAEVKEAYEKLKTEYPEAIQLIKDYVSKAKCKCCLIGDCDKNENCKNSKVQIRNYHFHPYGKRD